MTARWRSGAEVAPHTATAEFSSGSFGGATQVTSPVHRGTYALKFGNQGYAIAMLPAPAPTGAAFRVYFYRSGTVLVNATRILGLFPVSMAVHLAVLRLKTDFTLELRVNGPPGTLVATSAFTIPNVTWVCLELWVDTANKIVAARYNGAEWARATVATFGASDVGGLYVGPDEAVPAGHELVYDDMGLNSLDGPYNNGWCGPSEGGVLTFRPSANADPGAWTVVGAGSVYDALDEVTPDDGTSYIYEAAGTINAAVGVYFPDWPYQTPASCMLFGVRGGGTDVTARLMQLQFHDAADATAFSAHVDWAGTWKTVYPMLSLERAFDGTRRLLNNGYLNATAGPYRSRAIIVRTDALPRQIHLTSLWMTVDFPLALAAAPVPVPVRTAAALVQLELP